MKIMKSIVKKTFIYPFYLRMKERFMNQREVIRLEKLRGPVIKKYIPKGGIGAELGVFKGNFSEVLLNLTNPKELHLIDPWYFLSANWDWAGGNQSTVDALCKVLKSNKKNINEKKVFVHIQEDLIVLNEFPDGYFDWIYLDSTHQYEHTVAELELIQKKIKVTGVICGDDWQPDFKHRHHGVFKAVNEFCDKYQYKIIYANDRNLQWFIQKQES